MLSRASNIAVYRLFVLAAQVLVLTPIVVYAAAPKRSGRWLEAVLAWLERNNDTILIAVSLDFGVYFAVKGITGLMG